MHIHKSNEVVKNRIEELKIISDSNMNMGEFGQRADAEMNFISEINGTHGYR